MKNKRNPRLARQTRPRFSTKKRRSPQRRARFISLILAKIERESLFAERLAVGVHERLLRLVFGFSFQLVPLLEERATGVIDGAVVGPERLVLRRVAFLDLFDARRERVIIL